MKKINLLIPALSLTTIGCAFAPIATSCSNKVDAIIPLECLEIEGHTLKGLVKDADVSAYNTLSIPEDVKIIDENAFKDVFSTGTKEGKINKIIIPKSVKEIRKGAFSYCSSIRTIDLSSWGVDEIYYHTFADEKLEDNILGSFTGFTFCGTLIFDQTLSKEARYKLGKNLTKAGLWINWCIDETTGNIIADEKTKSQTVKNGYGQYSFHLIEKLPENALMCCTVTKTRGTENVGVTQYSILSGETKLIVPDENNNVLVPITLFNHLNSGDFADFEISFVTAVPDLELEFKPLWTETLTGFRLVNSSRMATSIEASLEKSELAVGETTSVSASVGPEEADDKTISYSSLNPTVALVNDHGIVTALKTGTTKIVVKANGGLLLTKELDIKVN